MKPSKSVVLYQTMGYGFFMMALSACDLSSLTNFPHQGGARSPAETNRPVASISSKSSAVLGSSCDFPHPDSQTPSADADPLCIGLKYVVYRDRQGRSVSSETTARENLEGINRIWKQCRIAFQIEKYEVVDPFQKGLAFDGYASESQNFQIRKVFEDDTTFLVVTTGKWNSWKNAWTTTPGIGPYGAVMEGSVASGHAEIFAHELGHYLNLDHSDTSTNVMSESIAHSSLQLSKSQCAIARQTATQFWPNMLR